jgi:hypothetical protein
MTGGSCGKGHWGGGGGGGGARRWVGAFFSFLGEFPAQKNTFSCFVFSQDAAPQMTQRTSRLCLRVGVPETPRSFIPNGFV